MISVLALVAVLHVPPGGWFGADKVKHFFMSAFVHSVSFSTARWAGANRASGQIVAGGASLTIGLLKEVYDRRSGRPFSIPDLVWDAAGAASAATLLNRTR